MPKQNAVEIMHVEPIGPLLHLGQLIGSQVQATVFDDPLYRHDLYVGEITQVKETKLGQQVYFKTDALVGGKWIPLHRVKGYVWYEVVETAKATAA